SASEPITGNPRPVDSAADPTASAPSVPKSACADALALPSSLASRALNDCAPELVDWSPFAPAFTRTNVKGVADDWRLTPAVASRATNATVLHLPRDDRARKSPFIP